MSSQALKIETIKLNKNSTYSYDRTLKPKFTGVVARYKSKDGEEGEISVGSNERLITYKKIYSSRKEAHSAAKSRYYKITRANESLTIETEGCPALFATGLCEISSPYKRLDGQWEIERLTHNLTPTSFTTKIELERAKI